MKKIPILLLVIITLAAAGVLSMAFKTTNNSSVSRSVSDWKTYTDPFLSFSIQYPPELTVEPNPSASGGVAQFRGQYNGKAVYLVIGNGIFYTESKNTPPLEEKTVLINGISMERQRIAAGKGDNTSNFGIMYTFSVNNYRYFAEWFTDTFSPEEITYHEQILSTFTNQKQTGDITEWKSYTSKTVAGANYKPFTIRYPASWKLNDTYTNISLDVTISNGDYAVGISQRPVGGGACLFRDSPGLEGPAADLKDVIATPVVTDAGVLLRRYYKDGAISFCQKDETTPFFSAPTRIVGALGYRVPKTYDEKKVQELDAIVKTITVQK